MNTLSQVLLRLLADGQFHSGTMLGQKTGRTRTAIWKSIQNLQDSGIAIYSVRGKGYRLAHMIELLDRESILDALAVIQRVHVSKSIGKSGCDQSTNNKSSPESSVPKLKKLEVFHDIKSTNAYLLNEAKNTDVTAHACLAEQQQAGRGRRGRQWVSPFGGNLYMSLLWQFNVGASQLGGLSLAIAVAIMRALNLSGLTSASLKWPNDILVKGKKLAGILLEVSGETSGPCSVVIGIGLNVRSPQGQMASIEQPWTDLETALNHHVGRNDLAAQLLHQLMLAAQEFELKGLTPFLDEWSHHDAFANREVTLALPQGNIRGTAMGVDETGALLLMSDGEIQTFHSGEVSLRAATPAAATS